MANSLVVVLFLLASSLSSLYGLKCREGFDMSLNGIPLYYWKERECVGSSKCIGQDISFTTNLPGTALKSSLRYGACTSSAYADYLECENLFGKDSEFDPAALLDMIPGMQATITHAIENFSKNISVSLKELLSDGSGRESFVNGFFTFYENLGFNLEKAVPLKASIVELLSAAIDGSNIRQPSMMSQYTTINAAVEKFFTDFSQLDTANDEFADALRSFLSAISFPMSTLHDPLNILDTTITRGPGLVRSIFPTDWQVNLWYDVAFKLMGNINPANWTKSTEDMVATIKSSYQIPADIAEYVNPILDAMPDLTKGSQVNPTYVGRWSLELLKKFSEEDTATQSFSAALIDFIDGLGRSILTPPMPPGMTLQYEYITTITWMPGLFYKLFPGDKAAIQEVYTKMADGFKSFDFDNISSTAPETKLSKMIKSTVTTLAGPVYQKSTPGGAFVNAVVVNSAKMFYDLMKVQSQDYTKYIDKFATVIEDGFKTWPVINVGAIMSKLITEMDGEVPAELKPLLENIQPIVTAGMQRISDGSKLVEAMKGVVSSYKEAYPKSPFPNLVERFIDLMYQLIIIDPRQPNAGQKASELGMELQYWNIDLQFAMVKSIDFDSDKLYQMMAAAWPEYHLYMRILRNMDSEDVKKLIKDVIRWLSTPPPHTSQGFVDATKDTFKKITKSIKKQMKEMRQWVAPDSCKFASCDEDLCNTRQHVAMMQEFKRDPNFALATLRTTTSSGNQISYSILLHIVIAWIAAKLFY